MLVKQPGLRKVISGILKILLISILSVGNICYAASLKKIDNPENDIKIYIYEKYILRDNSFVTYTIRLKDKNSNDYINIINTNCSDFSSAIILTTEYKSSYIPDYENIISGGFEYKPADKNSALYNAAAYACTSPNTYKQQISKPEKKLKNNNEISKDISQKTNKGNLVLNGFKLIGEGLAASAEFILLLLPSIL